MAGLERCALGVMSMFSKRSGLSFCKHEHDISEGCMWEGDN